MMACIPRSNGSCSLEGESECKRILELDANNFGIRCKWPCLMLRKNISGRTTKSRRLLLNVVHNHHHYLLLLLEYFLMNKLWRSLVSSLVELLY